MTDVYDQYRRKSGSREDPRLKRSNTTNSSSLTTEGHSQYSKLEVPISPKTTAISPPSEPRIRDSWQTSQPQAQYNNSTAMQTSYQHLQSTMYSDPNQYQSQGYSTSYNAYQQPGYPSQSNTYNPYQDYNQGQPGYSSGSIQPGPPGEEYPHNEWAPTSGYQGVAQQQVLHTQQMMMENDIKNEGVAQELKQQKVQMLKQREEYVRKVVVLRRELELLRNQKQELLTQHSSEHDNNHILRENNKLQIEIQNKMKTIYNVIEMLTNIIGDAMSASELEELYMDESPKHRKEKSRRSLSTEKVDLEAKFFYIYYDPELHWCRICDVFPKSAKEYLLHLHSKEHRQVTQERDMMDTPWHRLPPEAELPSFEGAPKKRMPIKGLQFLISATSWYCKLCDTWVGDLHCASQHLKSLNHNQNYSNFVEQNPHWEIEWLRDRDKALIRTTKKSGSEESENENHDKNKSKKRKEKYAPVDNRKDKKKKKPVKRRKDSSSSSSSSSSDSSSDDEKNDTSKSIHVSMRNKMKLQAQMIMNEDVGGKWEVLGRLVEEQKRKEAEGNKEAVPEDKLINQWMTVNDPQDKDRRLFNDLKDRMKQKQEAEKIRLAEIEQKRKEKEKLEQEINDKKAKMEKELREKEEAKRLQLEEMQRLRDKEREQIRFKTKDKNKKRSVSPRSPEKPKGHYSKSPERNRRDRSSDRYHKDNRYHENGRRSSDRRRRSNSRDSRHASRDRDRYKSDSRDRRSSHKKPHFIGRMPLYKNKKPEEKVDIKEIKKEDYDIPRQSRFQPGNLAKAFIPDPDVVCFPKLSSIPPLTLPRPPAVIPEQVPEAPQMTEVQLIAPPPPSIKPDDTTLKLGVSTQSNEAGDDLDVPALPPLPVAVKEEDDDDDGLQPEQMMSPDFSQVYTDPNMMDPTMMMQYQYSMDYNNMMYSHMYEYPQEMSVENEMPAPPEDVPLEPEVPAPPPPLPPDDPNDLAMLGISADDMAAQIF